MLKCQCPPFAAIAPLAALVWLCGALGAAHEARAEDVDDAEVTAAARALAIEGVKLAQANRCPDAIDKLERAEKLHHAPIVLAHLGECYLQLGRVVEGCEAMRAVLRDPPPANPSEAMQQAYAKAKTLLDANQPRIGSLNVAVHAPPGTEAALNIDGRALPDALIGAEQPIDPGSHVVQVGAPGYLTSSRKIEIKPGEAQSLTLTLVPSPNPEAAKETIPAADVAKAAQLAPPAAASGSDIAQAPAPTQHVNHWPAYAAWGVGAAALGVGIGFGIAAMHGKSQLDRACPGKVCGDEQRSLLSQSRTDASIATVGYGLGAAAAVLGTVLFLIENGAEQREAPQQARVRPNLEAGGAGLRIDM